MSESPPEEPPESFIARCIRLLTGARGWEQKQVICCFSALLCLMLSYYLVKPMRNSQFLKQFDPTFQPIIYLLVPVLSFGITKIFNFFCDRVDKYRLIIYVYLIIIGCLVAFNWFLPYGGKPATVIFYYWASVYFLLAMATLWACFNDFFTSEQGERFFGFVAMGATIGNIIGSQISSSLTESPSLKAHALLVAAGFQAGALGLLILAARMRIQHEKVAKQDGPPRPPARFWEDLTNLFSSKYVRGIAIMVAFLATFTTSLDFLSNKIIDIKLSRTQYSETFKQINAHLNTTGKLPEGQLNESGYDFIYGLKSSKDRDQALVDFATQHSQDPQQLKALYKTYQDELEAKTRRLFSDVYLYQGVVGVVLLILVARFVFAHLGLTVAVLILPTFAIAAVIAFAFPLELLAVEGILILSGALNYAVNNASKEILYTATTEETKFKHKPLIEGPIMRVGDVSASIMSITVLGLAGQAGLPDAWRDRIFLCFTFVLTLIWWRAIRASGRIYEQEKRQRDDAI